MKLFTSAKNFIYVTAFLGAMLFTACEQDSINPDYEAMPPKSSIKIPPYGK